MSNKPNYKKHRRRRERIKQDKAAGRVQTQPAQSNEPIPVVKDMVDKIEMVRRDDLPWPTISACMMVRDEEINMNRVLDSIKDVVDEIIIIDTGSKDLTLEVIRDHLAWPKIKLSEEPWTDNFSFHRNHTLEKASGDWLLIIDGDEELIFEDGFDVEALKIVLQNLPDNCSAVLIDLHDIRNGVDVQQHYVHRFLRAGSFHFRGIIHNTVLMDNPNNVLANCGGVHLRHYGYEDSDVRRSKFDRTERLLLKQLDMPDENLHTHFYLAELYGMREDSLGVIDHGFAYLAMKDDSKIPGSDLVARGFFGAIYYPLAKRLIALGRYSEVPKIIHEGLLQYPNDLDLLRALSDLGIETNNPETITMGSRSFCQSYASGQWRMEKAHPIFNATQEAFALNLYRLIIVRLDQLTKNFHALKLVLGDLTDEVKDNFLQGMGSNLEKSRILSAFNILPVDLAELIKPGADTPEYLEINETAEKMETTFKNIFKDDEAGDKKPDTIVWDPEEAGNAAIAVL